MKIDRAYATPPVRGDREAIARLRNSFVEICRSTDMRSGSNDPYANRIANEAIKRIDAILSSLVQLGAEEREALKSIVRECQRWRDEQPSTDGASKGWAQHLQGIAESALSRQAPHSSRETGS